MNTLILEHECLATQVTFSKDSFTVFLNDGRYVAIPLAWYPRILAGNKQECENYKLIAGGEGIHWPKLDEDISVKALLFGYRSQENQTSLKKWLKSRKR